MNTITHETIKDNKFPILVAITAYSNGQDMSFLNSLFEVKKEKISNNYMDHVNSILFAMYPGKTFKFTEIARINAKKQNEKRVK